MSAAPRYAWRDAAGTVTSLMNTERFVVLRDGIRGFADTTAVPSDVPAPPR